jgi:hypothetical protein
MFALASIARLPPFPSEAGTNEHIRFDVDSRLSKVTITGSHTTDEEALSLQDMNKEVQLYSYAQLFDGEGADTGNARGWTLDVDLSACIPSGCEISVDTARPIVTINHKQYMHLLMRCQQKQSSQTVAALAYTAGDGRVDLSRY